MICKILETDINFSIRLGKPFTMCFLFFACLMSSCKETEKTTETVQEKPYNVSFIMSDDLNTSLGAYGNTVVQTPHLDKLAENGTLFTQAHCQFPLCGPSRVSIMTGLRPDTTQVWVNKASLRETIPTVETLPQFFKNKGYFSGRVGKIFHYSVPSDIGTNGSDDALSWVTRVNPSGEDKKLEDKVINYTPEHGLGLALAYYSDPSHLKKHTDELVADEAIKLMQQHKDDPFFIAAGFFRPHTPYIAPKKYFDLYPLESIEIAKSPIDDLDDVPAIAVEACIKKYGGQNLTINEQKEIKRAYYACVSFMDAQVGKLMTALDELGLKENTIVVFMSDHGYNLGEHHLWEKMNLFEQATRVPLIVYLPGKKQPKTLDFAELIDLYPTLTEATGFQSPKYVQGKSLYSALTGKAEITKKYAVTAVARPGKKHYRDSLNNGYRLSGKSLRTPNWRFTEWEQGEKGIELYNKIKDPEEFNNLGKDTTYLKIVNELETELHGVN